MKVVIAIAAGDSNIGQMHQLPTGGSGLMQEFASAAVPEWPTVREMAAGWGKEWLSWIASLIAGR